MKILLVIPRYNLTNSKRYNYSFPLGLAYIHSAIKRAGYDLDCMNLNHIDGTISDLINRKLSNTKYDFVCTGHMCIGYHNIKEIITTVHSHETSPKVILGGAILTSEPEFMFNLLKPDFGVLGEGEITIVELLKNLKEKKSLTKVNGLIFKDLNKKIIITSPRPVIENLDTLPLPDFDEFGLAEQLENSCSNDSDYHNFLDTPRVYPIICSRSCPFQCTFCYHSLGSKYRVRSIKNVMNEIKGAIKKYDINALLIYDDLFSIDKKRLYDFCDEIKKEFQHTKKPFFWGCQLSVLNVNEEMLAKLKDSGCKVVSYGFESISDDVLKSMKKPITAEKIDNALKLTLKQGLAIQANFIFGDIAETKSTAYETLNYWKKNCLGQISLDFIQPYPGSEIYKHCLRKGIIKNKLDFLKNINTRYFLNMTEKMTDAEISILKKDILKATTNYRAHVIPKKITHKEGERHAILVKCPFCNTDTIYNNFRISNRNYFSNLIICRDCNKRFIVISKLKKIINNFSHLIFPLMSLYLKLKKKIKTSKL